MGVFKIKNPETGVWEIAGMPVETVGMQMDLLWSNPNPDAEFAAQALPVDLTNYDGIFAQFRDASGVQYSTGSSAFAFVKGAGVYATTMNVYTRMRAVTFRENNTAYFGDAYIYKTSETKDNKVLVPIALYGIRNVSSSNPVGTGTIESINHPGCFYRMVNGVQEWLNPPMELGVEYKTTERYNGRPVYVQMFDCGNLPNASYKFVAIPEPETVEKVIRANAITSDLRTLPGASGVSKDEQIVFQGNGAQVQFITYVDQSSLTATATAWYIRTTD